MKALVANGDVATVMPYGTVFDDIERGRLIGRRIVNPTLKRTLYFVRSLRRAPIQNENALLDLLGTLVRVFLERMGPLATGLPALDGPLSRRSRIPMRAPMGAVRRRAEGELRA